jgi:hypothetical protein
VWIVSDQDHAMLEINAHHVVYFCLQIEKMGSDTVLYIGVQSHGQATWFIRIKHIDLALLT